MYNTRKCYNVQKEFNHMPQVLKTKWFLKCKNVLTHRSYSGSIRKSQLLLLFFCLGSVVVGRSSGDSERAGSQTSKGMA